MNRKTIRASELIVSGANIWNRDDIPTPTATLTGTGAALDRHDLMLKGTLDV